MATETRKPETKSAIEGTAGRRSGRNRAGKIKQLVQLLKSRSGRDIAALSNKLGWQHHSTRAALSKLRKAGYTLEKLPPKKGGNSRYRITSGPAEPT